MTHADIIARLTAATGPDRELDADIFQMLGGDAWRQAYLRAQEPCGCPHDTAVRDARDRYAPLYTASLDACLALIERVLPGAEFSLTNLYCMARAELPLNASDGTPGVGVREDGSLPLALLLALFRALEAQEQP